MDYVSFGNTGLKVSVAGLGCGGSSRLGAGHGYSEDHSVGIVLKAFDHGVTLLDTAQAYGTESIVGKAVAQLSRDQVVISSKFKGGRGKNILSENEVVSAVDSSLAALGTDYIDIYNLHAVVIEEYDLLLDRVVPVLLREKEKGKIRHIGITEAGPRDHEHKMLRRAVDDGPFESIAVAYNMMNQLAHREVLPRARDKGIGSMVMFAVRAVFSVPGRLKADVQSRVAAGDLPQWMAEKDNVLDFLLHPGGADSIIDAAYRYVRHKWCTDVILFGTGNVAHLEANIASLLRPPLPEADVERLEELFGHLAGFGADMPEPTVRS
ncbi:aldo/keto reductase [Silicimonas sp. MF1-12-2]|uniref:aldo/keto reductase n=1 Tax=Silicimonas sp. MF1-12-2 TaxID=3384793 RepID=UPI0039B4EE07